MSGVTNPSPSNSISLGADPSADPNSPPLIMLSSVLSSLGVNTPSSSNGMNSISASLSGTDAKVNAVVEPSPLNTSLLFSLVLSSLV